MQLDQCSWHTCSASNLLFVSINGAKSDGGGPVTTVLIKECSIFIICYDTVAAAKWKCAAPLLSLKGQALHTEGDYCSLFLLEETVCRLTNRS